MSNDQPLLHRVKTVALLSCATAAALLGGPLLAQEILYNGIELPAEWPPKDIRMNCREPMPVPYLKNPPAVIPIDIGRQLFVDDFLIEKSTLKRVWHKPVKYEGNPVLKPERDYEGSRTTLKCSPVLYDPADRLFKVWYMTGSHRDRCLAVSKDGIHWERPELDVVPGTNYVLHNTDWEHTNGFDVELDHNAANSNERYKAILYRKAELVNAFYTSPDGVHWKEIGKAPVYIENMPEFRDREIGRAGNRFHPGDVCTFHWNPFRKTWVFDVKEHHTPGRGRARFYREGKTFTELPDISPENLVFSMGTDRLDKLFPGINMSSKLDGYMKITPQMYQRDAVAYESLMLGTFSLWYNQFGKWNTIPKINQIFVGFSRDGFHWDRACRDPFIPIEREKGVGNPEFGYLRPAGGGCVVVGDKLHFYYEGTSGINRDGEKSRNETMTINLAILRRDGFASMESDGEPGTLETRPVTFQGRHVFVNLVAPKGELKVEILDVTGKAIEPFTVENCIPVTADNAKIDVKWHGVSDLSVLRGRPVRFRFHLQRGALYAFWVSSSESGASNGYVASGGPGFDGPRDTP
jgi:hypothetical protein